MKMINIFAYGKIEDRAMLIDHARAMGVYIQFPESMKGSSRPELVRRKNIIKMLKCNAVILIGDRENQTRSARTIANALLYCGVHIFEGVDDFVSNYLALKESGDLPSSNLFFDRDTTNET